MHVIRCFPLDLHRLLLSLNHDGRCLAALAIITRAGSILDPKNRELILFSFFQAKESFLGQTFCYTGPPAYSDTDYSVIPATVTIFWSLKGSPYTENPGNSDILL